MSRRTVLALVMVGFLLSLPAVATAQQEEGTAQEPVVEAARQVTTEEDPLRLFSTPAIAVHPDDPLTAVVAVGDARNGGCGLHVTRDGGLSWTATTEDLMPEDLPFCIQRNFGPYISPKFASDGTLYVGLSGSSLETGHPNGPITALVARTSDLGATHDVFTVAEPGDATFEPPEGPALEGVEQHRYSSLAVDPTNARKVYVAWRRSIAQIQAPSGVSVPVRSMIAVSSDGGQTWTDPIDVQEEFSLVPEGAEPVFGSDVPALVVGPDGTAYAFTKERPPRAPEGEPRPASRLFMFKSSDGGETWSTTVVNEGVPFITNPSAAVDPSSGNLYVIWDARGETEEEPSEVYFMSSSDQGETWSEPVNLTDDDPARGFNQYFPGISVAPDGRIDVAWHDFRNDPFFTPGGVGAMGTTEGERYWDVYHTYSTDAGQTWAPNLRVTDRSIDGDVGVTFNNQDIIGPMGVASTDDAALLVWPDSRAGGPELQSEDAYFTRVRFAASPAGAAVATDNRWLWSILGAAVALAVGGVVLVLGTRMSRRPEVAPRPEPARVQEPS